MQTRSGSAALLWRGDTPAEAPAIARQPLGGGDGCRILFDGHLHRRPELADAVGRCGSAALPDEGLFAAAWARWGPAALEQMAGEFSAIVWDPRRYGLVAACSPRGAPPLYFHVNGARAIVATAPRGIFAWGDLKRRLDDECLSSYLVGYPDFGEPHRSYFADVRTLLPGEVLMVTPRTHRARVRSYYDLAEGSRRTAETAGAAKADRVEATKAMLRSAVGEALPRSGRPPAILLSGGMDSTALAITALEVLGTAKGQRTVTLTSRPEPGWDGRARPGFVADEAANVQELAKRYRGLEPRFVSAAGLGPDHGLEAMVALAELPPRNVTALVWIHECLRTAGPGVVLSGDTGNTTLSWDGSTRLTEILGAGGLRALPAAWREAGAAERGWPSTVRSVASAAVPWLHPALQRAARRRFGFRSAGLPPPNSPIHPQYARTTRVDARRNAFGPFLPRARSGLELRLRALTAPPQQCDARAVYRALAVLHGVRVRDPLGERRLTEWCLGLPTEEFSGPDAPRWLMRRVLEGRVPSAMLSAPRGQQDADWHLRYTRALPRIRDLLQDWRGHPSVAARIDIDRLLRVIDTWPARTPLSARDHPEFGFARGGISRALAAGTFIRWVDQGCPPPSP